MLRVVITGSRTWSDVHELRRVLNELLARVGPFTLAQGGARGADRMAKNWALSHAADGVLLEQWDADWARCTGPKCRPGHRRRNARGDWYCPTAGHQRNAEMVESDPDLVIAFDAGTKGTANAISHAKRAGVEVVRYTPADDGDEPGAGPSVVDVHLPDTEVTP